MMSPRRLQLVAIALSCMLLALVAMASAKTPGHRSARLQQTACVPELVEEVLLPGPTPIDEIRVDVARYSPAQGAVNVFVWDGTSTRVLRIRGGASQRLSFSPPITSERLHVSVEPVYTAPSSACVDRVELRNAGNPVVAVLP